MRFAFILSLTGILAMSQAIRAQEQGRPGGLPSSGEFAERFPGGQDARPLSEVAVACPQESEWHRNLLMRLLQDGRRRRDLLAVGPPFFHQILEKCAAFPPLNAWYRQSLAEARTTRLGRALLYGILDTWVPSDRDLMFEFVKRTEIDDHMRTLALHSAARKLPGPERVDWFFDVFEAGVLTEHYFRMEQGVLNQGVSAEAFASRGARSVPAHAGMPLAPLVMETVASTAATDTAVSKSTAAAVLRGLDQLVGRPEFSAALSYRAAVARAAGGALASPLAGVAEAQEQGRPQGLPSSAEFAERFFHRDEDELWRSTTSCRARSRNAKQDVSQSRGSYRQGQGLSGYSHRHATDTHLGRGTTTAMSLVAAWNAQQLKVDSVYVHGAPQGSQTKSVPQYCLMKRLTR